MKKYPNKIGKCNHFPIYGMDGDVKYGGCWKVIKVDMHQMVRECVKCGEIDISQLTGSNPEMFMSDGRRHQLNKDREENAVNMIQPIDSKTGKFNEEFGKHYGYNPLKTSAPQVQNTNNTSENILNNQVEDNLKINKL
jgi:hypothetical protein